MMKMNNRKNLISINIKKNHSLITNPKLKHYKKNNNNINKIKMQFKITKKNNQIIFKINNKNFNTKKSKTNNNKLYKSLLKQYNSSRLLQKSL